MEEMSTNPEELDNSGRLESLRNDGKFEGASNAHSRGDVDVNVYTANYIQDSFNKIHESINKIESEKLVAVNQELSYLRHVFDYQNSKIEKLTALMSDFFENKNQHAILSSLQAIQDNEVEQSNDVQKHVQQQVDHQVEDVQRLVRDQVEQQVRDQVQQHIPGQDLSSQSVHIDSNMDPALHDVAVAAVAAQAQRHPEKTRKRSYSKRRDTDSTPHSDAPYSDALAATKKPKINIDFLHNPMTVKEIYDEFTKGFRGQPPLCEMDNKYGKHEWRGDSRSKESKRYQRRKKLCDAIARGMQKYDKPAEEIIRYIEEFRGDKSLTWVMNGNLPADLIS